MGIAAVFALMDWYAVARRNYRIESFAKPAVMLALIASALLAEPYRATARGLLVVALVFGLLGDVALMLEHRPGWQKTSRNFIAGLTAFLVGHLFYVGSMYLEGFDLLGAGMGLILALLILLAFGFNIIRGADKLGGHRMAGAVIIYIIVLSGMLVFGVATASLFIAYGAIIFVASDLILGADRFVRRQPLARIAVIVTYHCAQAMLVIGLVQ